MRMYIEVLVIVSFLLLVIFTAGWASQFVESHTAAPVPACPVIAPVQPTEQACAAWLYNTNLASAKARMCGKK